VVSAQGSTVPRRCSTTRRAFTIRILLADIATADDAFAGEQHDDVNTHRLELAV
jgi:uncharacterized iron-regulated protein